MNKNTQKNQEPKVKEPKLADTIALAVENGLVAIDPTLKTDKTELEMPEETTSCADHISRTKVLDVINSTMAKYDGKVVLAMSEVRDIIKAITTAVNE